jgi:hypothetical protein
MDESDFAIRKAMDRFSWDVKEALNITEILTGLESPRPYPQDDRRFSLRNKKCGALTGSNSDAFVKSPAV